MSVSEGRPGAGRAVASGVMAEAGAMVPTSDSDLTGLSKVSVLQLLRMSLHERLCTTTLLQHSQARARDACMKRSIVALCGVAWVQQSPCGIAAVPRGGRRAATSGEKFVSNVLSATLAIYGHALLQPGSSTVKLHGQNTGPPAPPVRSGVRFRPTLAVEMPRARSRGTVV